VELEIAGEGPERSRLEGLVAERGAGDVVRLPGNREDVPALLRSARVVAHVSASEGCPNAVMEGMAAGRAVIATGVGDVPDLIADGESGFIVDPEDDGALTDRLERLLSDDALAARMGRSARAVAEREFGLDRLVAQTLDAYRAAGWRE
jgi:glycosyltransferase involved in cell wall biosynthesis